MDLHFDNHRFLYAVSVFKDKKKHFFGRVCHLVVEDFKGKRYSFVYDYFKDV